MTLDFPSCEREMKTELDKSQFAWQGWGGGGEMIQIRQLCLDTGDLWSPRTLTQDFMLNLVYFLPALK